MISESEFRDLDMYLSALEDEENVTIVAAWVMGSHARNVESPDSDIDINFVFIQPITHYASLTKERSSVRSNGEALQHLVPNEAQLETELEFMGWNAKRFLELLGGRDDGNNPSAIESLCSPLSIRTHPVIPDLREYVSERFNVIELYHHYRGLTKRNWRKYIEDDSEPTVKRMLYILRGVLYARYVRDTHELAPLDFQEFVNEAPQSIFEVITRDGVRSLIEAKREGRGDERIDKTLYDDVINEFLEEELDHRSHVRDEYIDSSDLDEFMSRLIRDHCEK